MPKPPMARRNRKLRLCLTDLEFASLERAARAEGLPVATWCRMTLLKSGVPADEAIERLIAKSERQEPER